jgi:WXG100 protein secretion system (Wss), protein YukD
VIGRRARLVTIVGPLGTRDVVVSADASLVFLRPVLVDLVGGDPGDGRGRDSPRWALYTRHGQVLPATRNLAACGVVDGEVLVLAASPPATARPGTEPSEEMS